MSTARYIVGDVLEVLRSLPDDSVDLVLTSPPFLALRSYLPADHVNKSKELGSEPTPGAFIDALLDVVEECGRVLAPHGSLCIELGDTYAGSGGAGGDYGENGLREGQPAFDGSGRKIRRAQPRTQWEADHPIPQRRDSVLPAKGRGWPQDKSLTLVPELFRISLAYGVNPLTGRTTDPWRIRNVIRWVRPNPPVGALGDKFRPATSEMVVATKSRTRYFDLDAVREPHKHWNGQGDEPGAAARGRALDTRNSVRAEVGLSSTSTSDGKSNPAGAPPLDWWAIPTEPYPGSHYACVDEETEALTPEGWKRHDQLEDGDLIVAYDRDRGVLDFEPASFHRYDYDGDLIAIDKRETVQRLTPNHRVLVRSQSGGERVVRADELRPSHRVPVALPFVPEFPPGYMDAKRAALLGWFITEGSIVGRTARIYQSQTVNPEKCATIRSLLNAANAHYHERSRMRSNTRSPLTWEEVTWFIRREVAEWLIATAPGKRLTAEVVFGWDLPALRALYGALIDGDGHRRANGREQFVTKHRDQADMFQALCCKLGKRSTISAKKDGGWSVSVGERMWLSLRGTNGASEELRREHYEGTVWCPSVPSSFWLARRNGRPFITGNTWPRDLLVRPIKAMCPERVCRVCGEPSRRVVEGAYVNSEQDDSTRQKATGRLTTVDHPPERGWERSHTTLGWTDCGHDSWRPGVVLDPFAGSGTTGAVATGHGRDAVLIDIDERNADLARERIGMFLTVEHHTTEERSA